MHLASTIYCLLSKTVFFTILWPQPTLTLPFLLKTSSAGCYFACSLYLPLGPRRNLRFPEAQPDQFVSVLLPGGDLSWFSRRSHRCCRMEWSEKIFVMFYWPAFSYKGGYKLFPENTLAQAMEDFR